MGKMYEVDGQVFAEAEVANRLMLLTEGDSLIQVDFDKFNHPSLKFVDGAVLWVGLPDSMREGLLKKITEEYPNGYRKRQLHFSKTDPVLNSIISTINKHERFKFKFITEEDVVHVNGGEYVKFNGIVEVEGHDETVVVFLREDMKKMAILKKFFHHFEEECASISLLSMVNSQMLDRREVLKRDGKLPKAEITYFHDYAILNEYEFDIVCKKCKLREKSVSAKNPAGWTEYGEYGGFLAFETTKYLKN